MSEIFKIMHHLFTDKDREKVVGMLEKTSLFTLNRFISLDMQTLWNVSRRVNRYVFRVPKEIVAGLLTYMTPVRSSSPRLGFIRKDKKEKLPDDLLQIKKFYGWSDRELEINMELINEIQRN